MPTPEDLRMYFAEHASQARKHEEQREKATSLILTIASALTGLITYAKFSCWSAPAALAIMLLGVYGVLFSAKHYERARMHTEILRQIRIEIDGDGNAPRSLGQLTQAGRTVHYQAFRWPSVHAEGQEHRQARSWLARQRLNVFWEAVHVLVFFIGAGLLVAIWVTRDAARDDVKNVLIVPASRTGSPQPVPGPAHPDCRARKTTVSSAYR